jgi:hypothetical protein
LQQSGAVKKYKEKMTAREMSGMVAGVLICQRRKALSISYDVEMGEAVAHRLNKISRQYYVYSGKTSTSRTGHFVYIANVNPWCEDAGGECDTRLIVWRENLARLVGNRYAQGQNWSGYG